MAPAANVAIVPSNSVKHKSPRDAETRPSVPLPRNTTISTKVLDGDPHSDRKAAESKPSTPAEDTEMIAPDSDNSRPKDVRKFATSAPLDGAKSTKLRDKDPHSNRKAAEPKRKASTPPEDVEMIDLDSDDSQPKVSHKDNTRFTTPKVATSAPRDGTKSATVRDKDPRSNRKAAAPKPTPEPAGPLPKDVETAPANSLGAPPPVQRKGSKPQFNTQQKSSGGAPPAIVAFFKDSDPQPANGGRSLAKVRLFYNIKDSD